MTRQDLLLDMRVLKFINWIKLFSLQVCLKVFDHNLITIRCWSSSWAVAWIILNLNKSLLTPTKSYLSNSGRSDSIIPIDSICGIVHYEITLHKLCLLSRVTLPTIFCKAIWTLLQCFYLGQNIIIFDYKMFNKFIFWQVSHLES